MPLDVLTFGEALVEVMRTEINQPLHRPALFTGPYPSGAPFIFAVQAARLDAAVAVIGAIGQDAFGRCLMDQLEVDGINTQGISILDDHPTGVAFVAYTDDGSRDFVFHIRGAAAGQLHPNMLNEDLFHDLKCLHLMGSTLSIHDDALQMGLRAIALAQQAGAKISFDPNLRPQLMPNERAKDTFSPFLEAADVLLPTEEELLLLTGAESVDEAANLLLDDKPECIIVMTQGADGCTLVTQTGTEQVNGFHVQEVDSTGAGDCFDAGFLVTWLMGWMLTDAARFANACGALAVTAQGPMAGASKLADVNAFMQDHTFS